jgi:hypothetical protein
MLAAKDPFDRFGKHDEALMRRAHQAARIVSYSPILGQISS